MPLYESYKPTNSVQVKEFAGSIVGDLAEAKKQLNAQYLTGLEYEKEARNTLSESANLINPEDAGQWNQINKDAESQINAITESGRYENALPALYQLSNQTAQRLKPLIGQKKLAEEFKTKLSDKSLNLTSSMQSMYQDIAKDENTGTKMDASGRVLNPWQVSKQPVKNIENTEAVQKMLQGIGMSADSKMESIDERGATYKIINGSSVEVLTKDALEKRLRAGISVDPNLQQSIRQQAEAKAFESAPGLTDQSATEFLKNKDMPIVAAAEGLMSEDPNLTPKRALLKAMANEQEQILTNNLIEYAKTGSHQKTSSSRTMEHSTDEIRAYNEEQARKAAEAKTASGKEEEGSNTLLGVTVTGKVSDWATVGQQVFDKNKKAKQDLSSLQANLANAKLGLTGGTQESRINAAAEVKKYERAIENANANNFYIAQAEQRLLQDAEASLFPVGGVKKFEIDAKYQKFREANKNLNQVKTQNGTTTLTELFQTAVYKQDYTILQNPTAASMQGTNAAVERRGTIKIGDHVISGTLGYDLIQTLENPQSAQYKKVYAQAATAKTEGLATRSTAIPISKDELKNDLQTLLPNPAAYDMANDKQINTEGFDWSKTDNISFIPELSRLSVTVPNAEGVATRIMVDASEIAIAPKMAAVLKKDKDPNNQMLGYALESGSLSKYISRFNQTGEIVKTVPGSGPTRDKEVPIINPVNQQPIWFKRVRDGSIVMTDASGNIIKDNLNLAEVTKYLELSKLGAK